MHSAFKKFGPAPKFGHILSRTKNFERTVLNLKLLNLKRLNQKLSKPKIHPLI